MSLHPSKSNALSPARRWQVLFVFIFALLGTTSVLPAAVPSTFNLAANTQVDSTGIFLRQLVKSDQPLPALRLTDAPEFGKTLELTRQQIADFVATAAPNLILTNWAGADSVEISRRDHSLTENAAIALLTATLQRDYVKDKGDLELNFTQPWDSPTVPDEPLTVRILEVPAAGVTSSFIIRFQLCTANETVGTWQASLQAHVWRNVWVAHSDLERGTLVGDADVTRERHDILSIYESLAEFSMSDASLELAEMVPAGNVLLARDLKPRTVMHRGQIADGLLQDGALNIMMKVEVLEDGAAGQIVKIRNPVSMHDLSGKIVDDQTIMISL
jgi:flagella basal body P-ring formation protein FlgA